MYELVDSFHFHDNLNLSKKQILKRAFHCAKEEGRSFGLYRARAVVIVHIEKDKRAFDGFTGTMYTIEVYGVPYETI